VGYSPSASEEIERYDLRDRLRVVDAVILLQHHRYREEKKVKLNLEIDGYEIWALSRARLWVFFHTAKSGDIYIHWVSQSSKVRP
jgi:hypothetical protein